MPLMRVKNPSESLFMPYGTHVGDPRGPFWVILVYFGGFWAIFGPYDPQMTQKYTQYLSKWSPMPLMRVKNPSEPLSHSPGPTVARAAAGLPSSQTPLPGDERFPRNTLTGLPSGPRVDGSAAQEPQSPGGRPKEGPPRPGSMTPGSALRTGSPLGWIPSGRPLSRKPPQSNWTPKRRHKWEVKMRSLLRLSELAGRPTPTRGRILQPPRFLPRPA